MQEKVISSGEIKQTIQSIYQVPKFNILLNYNTSLIQTSHDGKFPTHIRAETSVAQRGTE